MLYGNIGFVDYDAFFAQFKNADLMFFSNDSMNSRHPQV